MQLKLRPAAASERDAVFLMGYSAWSEGRSVSGYLELCRSSPKYAEGVWYVLENGSGEPVSSLVVYNLNGCSADGSREIRGIGSVATSPALRGKGYASAIVAQIMEELPGAGVDLWFLYSDIDPGFYRRLGFIPLPGDCQHHLPSVLMVRQGQCGEPLPAQNLLESLGLLRVPAYF